MGLFGEVKCGRCDRRYSAIRGRCPYCGARKRRAGKNSGGGGRWQMIAGVVLLAVIIIAVVVLIYMSLGPNKPAPTPTPTLPVSTSTPESTPPPEQTPEPTATQIPTPTPVIINSLTLNREDFTLFRIGEQFQMVATVVPAAPGQVITWTSLDSEVATINSAGIVTAVGAGYTTIVAEIGGVTAECIVRVTGEGSLPTPNPSGVIPTLSHTDVTLDAGTSESFRLTVDGTSETPIYYSEDSNIATVASNGKVTAVSEGTTTIYVTIGDNTLTCIVRVVTR